MLGGHGRGFSTAVFGPVAKLLVKLGVSADAVTITGTILAITVSFTLLARGHFVSGPLLLGAILVTDSIDGQMARLTGRASKWGAFLDSTLDRMTDACVFLSIALAAQSFEGTIGTVTYGFALAIVPLAMLVSYARARGEAVGADPSRGLAERTDRLIVALAGCLAVGLGAPILVLTIALGYVAIASAITVVQRMLAVKAQVS
ncbi:CDP-diacylglycerol--glycerol-3-phosphate 3-phosphatidyltransferase [Ruaniaceae bacterium KH17]|nr:CDP-diacylglycerol--glycerol-3-phosphate 3-phosphatidyltransferase [Ruaniaceae bacterium KH17]